MPALWLLVVLACAGTPPIPPAAPETPAAPAAPPDPAWPATGAPLRVLDVVPSAPVRVLLDAGHGAPSNAGNTGVRCQHEQDVTKRIADGVLARWAAIPAITAEPTRPTDAPVPYDQRLARANAWADVMISIHTDAREGRESRVDPTTGCWSTSGAAGFTVLWSDEGPLAEARHAWAVAIAERLRQAGFPPYYGYAGLYDLDPEHPGVYVDRHAPGQRIMLLRRTTTPTVIVETHQASDPEEVARWDEDRTLDAFAAALAAAIADVSAASPASPPPSPAAPPADGPAGSRG